MRDQYIYMNPERTGMFKRKMTRREFLKYSAGMIVLLGLAGFGLNKLDKKEEKNNFKQNTYGSMPYGGK